ncbi:MAG: phosphate ABC transporter permease subunit PstC, partial [Gammaproteobacteria bacterium]|nr:phosphate ABC transporter permease subunit PstC [Gammaproteobacteria bacterium]
VLQMLITSDIPARFPELSAKELSTIYSDIKSLTQGGITAAEPRPFMLEAVESYHQLQATSRQALFVVILSLAIAGFAFSLSRIKTDFRARNAVEFGITGFLIACSMVAVFTTLGIVLSVLFEAIRFFQQIPLLDFVFGLQWSPQTAIRVDQVGSTGAFGAVPLFAGTMLISFVAMMVAAPVGLYSAIYLSEYASARMRSWAKPMLEILAGIPTVVYGFFAALTVAPFLRDSGSMIGLDVSSESALAAGLVMGIMIIPFISSLSDDVITAVPQALRDGAYALGSTQSETIRRVVLPAALPGIVGGMLLGVSRAIGETMIVVMAAGLSANLTGNPLEAVTTVTVQIVTLLVGDQEFDSAKTLAAFALGLVLFATTLILNIIALHVVRKYREQYD